MLPPPDAPGDGRAVRRPLQESCRAFAAGQLNPTDTLDARSVLSGEGLKRIESFLFELMFSRMLKRYCPEMPVANGWYVLPSDGKTAGLWIRLDAGEGLNRADEVLLAFLTSQRCTVLKVRCPADRFVGCFQSGSEWAAESNLHALLSERFGRPGVAGQPERGSDERTARALDTLFTKQSDAARTALVLSRLLINCFIVPYIGRQPLDLDAVVLNESDSLRFIEFKRKYPSSAMLFGLDAGHEALARWLSATGHRLTNVILVDPCRIKNSSPLHLLDVEGTRRHVLWVAADVDPSLFSSVKLETSGADSGMFPTRREQSALGVSHYFLLGQGFGPEELRNFLNGEPVEKKLTEQLVKKAKQNAQILCSKADQTA